MRIPFDSFSIKSVVAELQPHLPARVQDIRQPTDTEIFFELYVSTGAYYLLLSAHPEYSRMHISSRKTANASQPPLFCTALRTKLAASNLILVEQINEDRLVALTFSGEQDFVLVAELMGKNSNLILLDAKGKVVSAIKFASRAKSQRPIVPGIDYEMLPMPPSAGSKVYRALSEALDGKLESGPPVFVPGHGAYPVPLDALGLVGQAKETFSIAVELAYAERISLEFIQRQKSGLEARLNKAASSHQHALSEIDAVLAEGGSARAWQVKAELLLAYGPAMAPGQRVVTGWDFEGNEVQIGLDEDLGYKEMSTKLFAKAKKAKERLPLLASQRERLALELVDIESWQRHLAETNDKVGLEKLLANCEKARWWKRSVAQQKEKSEALGGIRVREIVGPGGSSILYGENSEANDHLTLRIAKPDDYWLHVRGHSSAHVIIQTGRHPERIPFSDILYAGLVAVLNSNQKHASHVPVDYTLKKYVRKPRGAAAGAASYTNEKTLFIDPDRADLKLK